MGTNGKAPLSGIDKLEIANRLCRDYRSVVERFSKRRDLRRKIVEIVIGFLKIPGSGFRGNRVSIVFGINIKKAKLTGEIENLFWSWGWTGNRNPWNLDRWEGRTDCRS